MKLSISVLDHELEFVFDFHRSDIVKMKVYIMYTLGQKPTFYPEITKNLMFEKCEFYGNDTLKM